MSLLGNLISGIGKEVLADVQARALPGLLSQVLARTDLGNVGGLLAKLQEGGLQNQVASWLSNGGNLSLTPEQLRAALGDDQVRQIAQAAGIPVDQLLGMLAQQLPTTIDTM